MSTFNQSVAYLGIFILYICSGWLGIHYAAIGDSSLTLIWMPAGIALASFIIYGRQVWPIIWLGSFTANMSFLIDPQSDWPILKDIGFAGAAAFINSHIQGAYAFKLYKKHISEDGLFKVQNILHFITKVILPPCFLNTLLLVVIYTLGGYLNFNLDSLTSHYVAGVLADFHGYFIVCPLAIAVLQIKKQRLFLPKWTLELFAFGLMFVSLLAVGFSLFSAAIYLLIPLGVFIAIRLGMIASCLFILVLSLSMTGATASLIGPFVQDDLLRSLFSLLIFIFSVSIPVLLLASEDYERRDILKNLESTVAKRTQSLRQENAVLEEISRRDSLTGCANRRYFDEYLKFEWDRAKKSQCSLALLMIDVDHFKAYNDCYGHMAGDQCLRKVAKALAEVINRPRDLLARYGGEEFAIIFPDTDDPLLIAQRCRQKIEQLQLQHAGSKTEKNITISIGCSAFTPDEHCTIDQLLEQADIALYQAKENGRNQALNYTSIKDKNV